ncbi:MAG: phosphate ABC transporter ATP-binding protein [Gemmatimonadota bacterium]|nr:phosphate ABC transporter ATP-binding protein [Gemmatimonadota bacterium]
MTETAGAPHVQVRDLSAGFATRSVLRQLALDAPAGRVLAIVGPSGCGKSTVLRCINRLHELDEHAFVTGHITIGALPVYAAITDPVALRRRVGMVFQRPTPFVTQSVFENVAAGVTAHRRAMPRSEIEARVEVALQRAGLWREVEDRLFGSAMVLSGGQQQRLCIARALAVEPDVLLLDEPTASLDPMGTQRIEELLYDLRDTVTVIMVTHNMQQAARISDTTAFLLGGRVVECAPTRRLFTTPSDPRTEAYVTGRFG